MSPRFRFLLPALALACSLPASADIIGGVDFPGGVASFADAAVSYSVGSDKVTAPHRDSSNALGVPDYAGATCSTSCTFVSLGSGGSLVLRFTDNVLTGSGSSAFDLWVFEIGPDVEDTFVAVSEDGIAWLEVGKVSGGTRGIDLDFYGYGTSSEFAYVRLIDDPDEGSRTGATAGADIDAVGAISTRVFSVGAPSTAALLPLALLGLLITSRRRR
jgi:hypothetical protein